MERQGPRRRVRRHARPARPAATRTPRRSRAAPRRPPRYLHHPVAARLAGCGTRLRWRLHSSDRPPSAPPSPACLGRSPPRRTSRASGWTAQSCSLPAARGPASASKWPYGVCVPNNRAPLQRAEGALRGVLAPVGGVAEGLFARRWGAAAAQWLERLLFLHDGDDAGVGDQADHGLQPRSCSQEARAVRGP